MRLFLTLALLFVLSTSANAGIFARQRACHHCHGHHTAAHQKSPAQKSAVQKSATQKGPVQKVDTRRLTLRERWLLARQDRIDARRIR